VVRRSLDPDRLAAHSAATAAAPALPLARVDARAALARLALPLAVAALAVGVATPGVVGHALYGDEVASARIVTEPAPRDVLRHVRKTESTPPVWYLVAWGARKATDADVASLRLLSVLFAAAAAALTAIWALRLLGSQAAAGLAGSLVALGSLPAEYAEQLRAYALVVLVSVAFGMLLAEAAHRPRRRWLVALAAATWLGTLTHYFFFFVVAAAVAWLRAARPRPPAAGRATFAIGAGAAAFLPWLPGFLEQQAHGRYRWIGPFDAAQVATLPGELFFGPDGLFYGLARLALTGALLAGAIAVWWRREEASVVAALGLIPIAVAAAVWAAGQPIFDERNMLAAGGAVPGHPRRGGGGGVACAPRPRRGGRGHRRRAVRCRVYTGDARPRRLRLGCARSRRSRLECPRAADRRLPDRCGEPARGRDPDRLGGVLVPPGPAGARMGAGPPQLPRPLRDRAVGRSEPVARALPRPRERDPGLHLLRPPDPGPPAGPDRARPLHGADPRPRRLVLRAHDAGPLGSGGRLRFQMRSISTDVGDHQDRRQRN
jgi:hypothetical protein